MKYATVAVRFTNGDEAEFDNVSEQQSTDAEYRFQGVRSGIMYSVMKRNVNFIVRTK